MLDKDEGQACLCRKGVNQFSARVQAACRSADGDDRERGGWRPARGLRWLGLLVWHSAPSFKFRFPQNHNTQTTRLFHAVVCGRID
jgi:hypothetical protein